MFDAVWESVVSDLRAMNYATGDMTGATRLGAEGLDLDSLAVAELAARVEDTYGVRFAEDDFDQLVHATVGDFVAAVVARVDPALVPSDPDRH